MKKLLIRADDLGFSEAVNYGIEKTVRDGLIKNCGVMVNMPATEHAVRLFSEIPCCLGLHCNVSVGYPLCAAQDVPTLVDEKGMFHNSKKYRNAAEEFATVEDFHRELTAQYRRFVELFHRKPSYFEAHAVSSQNLCIALEQVAKENDLFYQPFFSDFTIGNNYVVNVPMHSMEPEYDACRSLMEELEKAEDGGCYLYVCHPGYLDAFLLRNTSLTIPRTEEVDMLCNLQIREWLKQHDFTIVTYDELAALQAGKES